MSAGFKLLRWNRCKIAYDAVLAVLAALCIAAYIAAFIELGPMLWPADQAVDSAIHEMRAFGSCAFLMLMTILCIGPLARLVPRNLHEFRIVRGSVDRLLTFAAATPPGRQGQ